MATLVSDLIQTAYENLAVVQPGELISSTLQTNGFAELLQMMASFSTEGATVFTEQPQTFTLTNGVSSYTLGVGGTMSTSARAQRVVAWKAINGVNSSGGAPLPYDAFEAASSTASQAFAEVAAKIGGLEQAMVAEVLTLLAPYYLSPSFSFPSLLLIGGSAVPMLLAADTAWPLINIRTFPAPLGGTIDIVYWTPITAFATVGDTVSLPPGFEEMIHTNLSVRLYPKFSRVGGMSPELAANAQNSKASIVAQNSPIQIQPPQPQAQSQTTPPAQ